MYSAVIADRRLYAAVKEGLKYKRLPVADSIGRAAELEHLRKDVMGKPLPPGQLSRALTKEEREFIDSELTLCKFDFAYYFTRYHSLELDSGVGERSGIGPPILLESQRRIITLIGRRENECFAEKKKYNFTEGIKVYIHKVRQITATAVARGLTIHRMKFWPGTRALAATLDDPRIGELFKRDKLAIDYMPFWMKPNLFPDVKDTEIGFTAPDSSRISYQAENAQTGIGVGSQNDVSHLTETALWKYPGRIRYSFTPSLPKAITTLHIQESTADGKGNYWHEVTEAARHKREGFETWVYAFIPWWYNKFKYRANPTDDWRPNEHTQRHAELVRQTSPEFNDGVSVTPTREQLYWWEKERAAHVRNGELHTFLTNYPATPEQSFQSFSAGALPTELLELMEQETMLGMAYDYEIEVRQGA